MLIDVDESQLVLVDYQPKLQPVLHDAQAVWANAARLAAAQARLGVATVQKRCGAARQSDEIVVCVDRGEDLRVPSTADSDPSSLAARRALNNGIPRAPQLDRGSCKGQPGCVVGGWAPPPIYVIDPAALPQAPEGSDADKIAKGEMPDR